MDDGYFHNADSLSRGARSAKNIKTRRDECIDSNEWRKIFITKIPTKAHNTYVYFRTFHAAIKSMEINKNKPTMPPSTNCCIYQLSGI